VHHWSAACNSAKRPRRIDGADLFLLVADWKAEAEVLGQLVLRVQSIGEVDATHATVGVYLHSRQTPGFPLFY